MMFYFFVLICKIFLFNQLIVNIADGAKSPSTTVINNSTKSIDLFGADGKFSNYSLASDEQRKQILAIDVNKKFTVAQKQAEFDKILTIIEKDLHTKLAAIEHGDADISDDDDDDEPIFESENKIFDAFLVLKEKLADDQSTANSTTTADKQKSSISATNSTKLT